MGAMGFKDGVSESLSARISRQTHEAEKRAENAVTSTDHRREEPGR